MRNTAFPAFVMLLGVFAPARADEALCKAVVDPGFLEQNSPDSQDAPAGDTTAAASIDTGDIEGTDTSKETRSEVIATDTDDLEIDREGELRLKNARIRRGERTISAGDIQYSSGTGGFKAQGQVEYRDPQIRVRGSSGSGDEATGARIGEAEFELPSRPARGAADEITVSPRGRVGLKDVRYTTCPPGNEDWALKASSITLDTESRNGTGKGVRLEFKGVPILYTPIISFPLGDERKSGFLFPDFGHSNRSGIILSVPYYFNLAPNYDLTLTPKYLSLRGVDLDADFRYLTRRQQGSLQGSFLPSDRERLSGVENRDRSLVRWRHQADFARDWRVTVDAMNASDDAYFEDFGQGPEDTSVTYLERDAELNHYGRHWRLLAQFQNFQTIDQTIPESVRPYSRVPRLLAQGLWDDNPGGFVYSLNSELTYFLGHDTALAESVNGARLDLTPEIKWSFERPGLYLTPAAAYRETRYALDNVTAGLSDSPTRGAPFLSLDTGMTFERESGSRAQRIQTLEPRLLYLYVPYRRQDDLPLFDTGLPDLSLVQLFRRNRYVGADRLSDANQLSAGVTTRLLDTESGRQFLSATFGQIYYFDSPRVTLPGETPGIRETSNFITQLQLTAYRDWNVNLGYEWNPENSRAEKTEAMVQYRPGRDRVVNLGYRFRHDLLEQVDASIAWPVARRWNVYARGVYSLRDNSLIEQLAGFEYASCCWRLRLVQRHYVSDRTGERDRSIALQLELKGLSSVGVPADAFLKRSIRGYSPRDPGASTLP